MTYTNRATEIQDEGNGSSRVTKVYQNDGLGRLAAVCEVTSVSQMSVSPSACGQDITATGFLTNYTYDALGNLLTVGQSGLNNRTYTYDFLSRLTSESNPETNNGSTANTITYSYDSCSAGDLCSRIAPKPNQTGSAAVTTSYTYDTLHRLTSKIYNDSVTSNVAYAYDQIAPWGWTITNPKGNLTLQTTATQSGTNLTQQMFDYDSRARVIETGRCTPINCSGNAYHFNYTYDFLGNPLTENNNSDVENITYTNTYDTAGRLTQFQSNLVNSTHPGTLYTVNQYNPLGEVQQATFGNGIVRNVTYDKLGRSTAQTDGSLYSFTLSLAPDSNVLTGNDSVNGNWIYAYDDFNRLATATQTSGSAFNYKYDRFGNRWQQNLTAGSGPAPSYSFDANNHTPSFTYDAAGNITNDGSHNYTYDAEGRMLSVDGGSTATYLYDASGRRVEEVVYGGAPTDFIYDVQGHMVTEATASTWIRSELYAGDGHVALYANGTTYFMHTDWLGSTKNQSDMTGASAQWCNYLPFADGFGCPGPQLSSMSFTGDQWDGETGLSHTLFRQYNPTQGRWMTPDPAGMVAADPTNPQSWNRYAYVVNNPLTYVDPFGLWIHLSCVQNPGDQHGGSGYYGDVTTNSNTPGVIVAKVNEHYLPDPRLTCVFWDDGNYGSQGPSYFASNTRGFTGYTVSAVHKQPNCNTFKALWKGLEAKIKLGPELQLGSAKVGITMYKNLSTGSTGSSFDATSGYLGITGDNPTPDGGSFNSGGPNNIRWDISLLGYHYDLSSRSWTFNPSKNFAIGIQGLLGGEVSFNSNAFFDECHAEGVF